MAPKTYAFAFRSELLVALGRAQMCNGYRGCVDDEHFNHNSRLHLAVDGVILHFRLENVVRAYTSDVWGGSL